LLFLLFFCGPSPAQENDADLEDWVNGPIRYIALKAEMQAFRALETDPARALFIERFWARRDPTPETLTNEYRQLFWERVQQANANFIDSPKPGWMTDRGKIHILYGPPTEIQEDLHLATDGLPAAGRGVIRWIYEGRPGQRMDVAPVVVVPFVRDAGGEYRVSYDPDLSSVFFDANAIREDQDRTTDKFLDIMGAQPVSSLSVMLDLGRMQEVPPQEQVLLERVETMEAYDTYPVRSRVDRYTYPGRNGNLTVLTLDIADTAAGEKPAIIARFAPHDATRQPRLLGEDSFRVWESDGIRVAQGRISLDPGSYTLTLLVADPIKVRTGLSKIGVEIPDGSGRFRFSDVAWASTLESLQYASLASHDEPYLVGPFRVVPRLDAAHRRGETLKLFFEVYDGAPPLRISYQLEGQEQDGRWVPLGQPSISEQEGPALAWELPTTRAWPLGRYRVRIEVTDAEGRLISRQVPFTLEEAEPVETPPPPAEPGP